MENALFSDAHLRTTVQTFHSVLNAWQRLSQPAFVKLMLLESAGIVSKLTDLRWPVGPFSAARNWNHLHELISRPDPTNSPVATPREYNVSLRIALAPVTASEIRRIECYLWLLTTYLYTLLPFTHLLLSNVGISVLSSHISPNKASVFILMHHSYSQHFY